MNMSKRIISICLAGLMAFGFFGCRKKDAVSSEVSIAPSIAVTSSEPQNPYEINPLTGTQDMKKSAKLLKPVAIMINNIETAQGVQSSLSKADIIYETFVEGGITRLMAVYKDIRTVGKNNIGSLRSGRYSYVDLALGNGAQFVHAGLDEVYCKPHIGEVGATTVDLNTTATSGNVIGGNNYAFRVSNGLSYEHTLFTTGTGLYKGLKDTVGLKLKKPQENWMKFVKEGQEIVPKGGKCQELYVPFSGSYSAQFKFNSTTGTYDKYRFGAKQVDCSNNKTISVSNILVLYSTISTFPDGKHVMTDLSSGSGYYVSNGGYSEINWSKGQAQSSFKITDSTGKEIDYNPGKTYVCLTNTTQKSATTIS